MTLGSGQIIFQEFAVLFFGDQIFTIKSVAPISMAPLAHFQQRFYNLYHLGAMPRSEGKVLNKAVLVGSSHGGLRVRITDLIKIHRNQRLIRLSIHVRLWVCRKLSSESLESQLKNLWSRSSDLFFLCLKLGKLGETWVFCSRAKKLKTDAKSWDFAFGNEAFSQALHQCSQHSRPY